VVSNWSTDPGLILLTDLSPESSSPRLLSVHAENSHGKSELVYLTTADTGDQSGEVSELEDNGDRQSVLYIIISVLCSIMILSLLLSLSHFCRSMLFSFKILFRIVT